MGDPTTLFSYERHIDVRSLRGDTLLVTLGAFGDAGGAQRQLNDHLLNTLPSRIIGRMDMDQVYDYAARRPEVTLDHEQFTDYEAPEIILYEVTGPDDEPFFLLTGPEPSFQWERVAGSLRIVIEQLGIRRTVIAQSFPAPVPHTRELPVTRFAGQPSDIVRRRPMPAAFRIRAPFSALLTLRLDEAGIPVTGIVAHVPQYLHESDFPQAALALFEALAEEHGPSIQTTALEVRAAKVRQAIEAELSDSPQLQEMVAQLEAGFDRTLPAHAASQADVPDAEEIGAEIENYLRSLEADDTPNNTNDSTDTPHPDTDEDDHDAPPPQHRDEPRDH